jgi:hypothetical protein
LGEQGASRKLGGIPQHCTPRAWLRQKLQAHVRTPFDVLRDYFPVLFFVVLPRTLAAFRLFR